LHIVVLSYYYNKELVNSSKEECGRKKVSELDGRKQTLISC